MTRDVKSVLEELRKEVEDDELQYLQAKERLEDPEYVREYLRSIKNRMIPLMTYNPKNDDPHVAVFVVASMQERLGGLFADLEFLDNWEERKAQLKEKQATSDAGPEE